MSALPPAERILIIKPSSLGDIIHGLPVLAALRRAYPDAHIAWLVGTSFAPLLDHHPLLDEVIRFDRKRYGKMWKSLPALRDFLRFTRSLRTRRFDLVIDLQGLVRSAFFAAATRARRRIGFADARELAWLAYSRRVRPPQNATHAVDKNLAVVRALELPCDPVEFPLARPPGIAAAVDDLLTSASEHQDLTSFTAVAPGARWSSKRWPTERWARLLDQIADSSTSPLVLVGAPDERERARAIVDGMRTRVIDLVGRTSLAELTEILRRSDRVICHDSGPMHIAAALNKPLVALFGPTSPVRTGPYNSRSRVLQLDLPCVPCYERRCPLRHHNCFEQLTVATVHSALGGLSERESSSTK